MARSKLVDFVLRSKLVDYFLSCKEAVVIAPPPGYFIETNGRRWRWCYPGYTSIFEYRSRNKAVRRAWSFFKDKAVRDREKKWVRETGNEG